MRVRSISNNSSSIYSTLSSPTDSESYLSSLSPLLTSYLDVIKFIIKADIYESNKEESGLENKRNQESEQLLKEKHKETEESLRENERRLADALEKCDASEQKLNEVEKKLVVAQQDLLEITKSEENVKYQRMQLKVKEYEDNLKASVWKVKDTEKKLAATLIVLHKHFANCQIEADEDLETARRALRPTHTAVQIANMEGVLIEAASDGLVHKVESLLEEGLHVNCAGNDGDTPCIVLHVMIT
eukprot:GHVR01175440.1.p1 GENE.GHVR01175440.1~~GHVR01175440.1.p1  ORF type:complete len:262 (+),score=45.13 GHVR01175440.1:55-786(+)